MFLPKSFSHLLDSSRFNMYTDEIIQVNQKTKAFGLTLTRSEIESILVARNQVLAHYSRVELGIEVTKGLAESFSASPYVDQSNYVHTLYELQEIFYFLKNETEDEISDTRLIQLMRTYFDGECSGSLDLLKSRLDEFAQQFRSDVNFRNSILEGDQ